METCPQHSRPGMLFSAHGHRLYRLTCDEFAELTAGGVCDVCRIEPAPAKGRRTGLQIDHDHRRVWAVRGVVCASCNGRLALIDRHVNEPNDAELAYLRDPWWARQPGSAPTLVRATRKDDPASRASLADGSPWAQLEPDERWAMSDDETRLKRQPRRPNGAEYSRFEFRVPADVLAEAKARAAEREETLASAIVAFLKRYAK